MLILLSPRWTFGADTFQIHIDLFYPLDSAVIVVQFAHEETGRLVRTVGALPFHDCDPDRWIDILND